MKINIRRINCILLILSILLGTSVEIKYLDAIHLPNGFTQALILLFCITGIWIERRSLLHRKVIEVFVIFTFFFLIYGFATKYNLIKYFLSYALFFLIFFIYCYLIQSNNSFHVFIYSFRDIILVISIISLIFWVFGSILKLIPNTIMTYTWGNRTRITYNYYYLYFENPVQNVILLGSSFPRNCGIYTEAPGFSGILLLALGVEIFGMLTTNKKNTAVFIFTLLSTQSTKALVIMIILFGIRYVLDSNLGINKLSKVIKYISSILIIITAIIGIIYILQDKSTGSSFTARMNHLISGFETWRENPVFGAGYQNKSAIVENQEEGAGYGGLSMGLTVLLAYGGLYLFLFYFYAFFYGLKNSSIQNNKKKYSYFALIILLNLFVSNGAFQYHYIFLISAAYAAGVQRKFSQPIVKI